MNPIFWKKINDSSNVPVGKVKIAIVESKWKTRSILLKSSTAIISGRNWSTENIDACE